MKIIISTRNSFAPV